MNAKDIILARKMGGGGGGTEITDGIVVKGVNANNYPTEIDIYGESIRPYTFASNYAADTHEGYKYVEKVNFKNAITTIGAYAFCGLNNYVPVIPDGVITIGGGAFRSCGRGKSFEISIPDSVNTLGDSFLRGSGVARYIHRNARNLYRYGSSGEKALGNPFYNGSPSELCQYGDVGYPPVTDVYKQMFPSSYSAMTMVVYTIGTAVDDLLTSFRSQNTKSTFVAKAAEDTTYNGVSYTAGETILISEVA